MEEGRTDADPAAKGGVSPRSQRPGLLVSPGREAPLRSGRHSQPGVESGLHLGAQIRPGVANAVSPAAIRNWRSNLSPTLGKSCAVRPRFDLWLQTRSAEAVLPRNPGRRAPAQH